MATAVSGPPPLRRWGRRACTRWESSERDSELWIADGNCLVHLQAKGQQHARKAPPAFKLSFSALLAARCFPFVQRFLVTEGYRPQTADEMARWYSLNPRRIIELYVPPPPPVASATSEQQQKQTRQTQHPHHHQLQHHLAVRNLLAWATGRPLVGQHLGTALVTLLRSIVDARTPGDADVADLVDYLDRRSYRRMANQPHRAMAILALAETFQLRELYVQAFVHCVGMSERLSASAEYQNISAASRQFIVRARADLDARLKRTSAVLGNFLDNELSEAHVGIPGGVCAHLDRFRSFIMSFYSLKFGYYPPHAFDAVVYRAMGRDFALLHELLRDDAYTCLAAMPSAAVGGICTLQLAQSFDARHGYEPLPHPLPCLPQPEPPRNGGGGPAAKRLSWLPQRARDKADARRLEHAALVRASNWREEVFENGLVRAYRRFEEDLVLSPNRTDRQERVSSVDGRKVRWMLVYAVHQALRHATRPPTGIDDDEEARYLLAAPTDGLPPWTEPDHVAERAPAAASPTSRQAAMAAEHAALANRSCGGGPLDSPHGRIEIKPDIDYFALTHKEPSPGRRRSMSSAPTGPDEEAIETERTSSFSRVLSRSSTFRMSVRRLTRAASSTTPPGATSATSAASLSASKPLYHEIVVHGYGNGTNSVSFDEALMAQEGGRSVQWASRSASTASKSCSSSASSGSSAVTTPSPPESFAKACSASQERRRRSQPQGGGPSSSAKAAEAAGSGGISKSNSLTRRPISAAIGSLQCLGQYVEQERRNIANGIAGRRHSLTGATSSRSADVQPQLQTQSQSQQQQHHHARRQGSGVAAAALLLSAKNVINEEPCIITRESLDWTAMQAFLDAGGDVLSAWEQYAELGGLTEM